MTTAAIDLHRILNVLSDMYLQPPTREALEGWSVALRSEQSAVIAPLKQAIEAVDLANDQDLEQLQTEYARLFVGPAALPCPPWESIYTSPGRQMMQEAHDAMQSLLADAGLAISMVGVLPDHIGAELHFLALLIERMSNGSEPEQQTALVHADRLIDEHLNAWIPAFTGDLENASRYPLYKALAATTRDVVAFLQD